MEDNIGIQFGCFNRDVCCKNSSPARFNNKLSVYSFKCQPFISQIKEITNKFFQAKHELEIIKFDNELLTLAKFEAEIMKKYIPNYEMKWPPPFIPINSDSLSCIYLSNKYNLKYEPLHAPNYSWLQLLFGFIIIFSIILYISIIFPLVNRFLNKNSDSVLTTRFKKIPAFSRAFS